jgi:hypothetical protein
MTHAASTPKVKNNEWIILCISAIIITMFLFFIDEGYYNFKWMVNIGNWIAFLVYFAAIFLSQMLFSIILLKKYNGQGKTLISILAGTVTGIVFVIGVIFTNW